VSWKMMINDDDEGDVEGLNLLSLVKMMMYIFIYYQINMLANSSMFT